MTEKPEGTLSTEHAAVDKAWQRLGAPGTWWAGEQRVALARASRVAYSCPLCAQRLEALSPAYVNGVHADDDELGSALTDVVHRITTDPSRLSQSWYRSVVPDVAEEGPYVEMVGVVAATITVDSFYRGIGVDAPPLPSPKSGCPTQERPEGAHVHSAWVPTVVPEEATGEVAEFYGVQGMRPGEVSNIRRSLTLVPAEARAMFELSYALYLSPERRRDFSAGRTLTRSQIELVAARVSSVNDCFY